MSDDPLGVGFSGVCALLRASEVEAGDAWWSTSVNSVVAFLCLGL